MNPKEIVLKGISICRGVAIGKPFFFSMTEDKVVEFPLLPEQVENEIARYKLALQKSKEEIKLLQDQLEQAHMYEGKHIIESQQHLIQEPFLTTEVEQVIRIQHKNAEAALRFIINQYQQKFHVLEDPFFRERFKDVQDISRRVLGHLRASIRVSLANLPPDSVVFSRELTTSDTAEANIARANAFVTEFEGITSHAAIVARSRGTPYVSSIDFSKVDAKQHQLVIVDGRTGEIILNPTEQTLSKYKNVRDQLHSHVARVHNVSTLKTETFDGYPVRLSANIEVVNDLEMLHKLGGHGVGLFRSEYILLTQDKIPTETEQTKTYCELVEKMNGLPIVIRTFDIGGDKKVSSLEKSFEMSPGWSYRAIRFLLQEKTFFKTQLRSILRASAFGDVSIMFPMISTLEELKAAKEIVNECMLELKEKKEPYGHVRIGCMIEVPSAAIIADLLAQECDFLSIGTNDLVQYALAVDRGSHMMSSLYKPTHPSMIRLIKMIVQEANKNEIPVSMCGEFAADPRFTSLLLGLGVQELSVATRNIPVIKQAIRNISIVDACRLARKALTLSTDAEVENLIQKEYQLIDPEDCLYNC